MGAFAASAFLGASLLPQVARAAMHYQVIKSFGLADAPGQKPYAGVTRGNDGRLYGTTLQGGSDGAGTVFKLNRDGSGYSTLHVFTTNNADGQSPMALCQGSDGALYGTTSIGGSNKAGTVFKLNAEGSGYGLLHQFGSVASDGQNPQAGLLEGSDGALYGTTFFGGSNDFGTVFKLNPDGSGYQVLRHFTGLGNDGGNPDTALVQGSDGALYGTAFFGGTGGAGTVFKLNRDGSGFMPLRSFSMTGGDGQNPDAALAQGSDGALYGTTYGGGSNNVGILFKVGTNATGYGVLHTFQTAGGDGQKPLGALFEGRDGALYGTTYLGGSRNAGALFSLNKDGSAFAVLHSFSAAGGDGQNPRAGLAAGSDGAFYGTTWSGGASAAGTVFQLLPPQTPDMLDAAVAGATVQVRFAGLGGFQYQVWRSTDLANWSLLGTATMPPSGICTNLDLSAPGQSAWYRAAWVP